MLYLGDCIEAMSLMPDSSVDLVLTDPPYKPSHTTGGATNSSLSKKWQGNIKAGNTIAGFDIRIKPKEWMPEIFRLLKDNGQAYVFSNDKNMLDMLVAAKDAGFNLSNILVWHKNNCTPNRYYMKNGEFIIFLYKGAAVPIRNLGSKTVVRFQNINGKQKNHPTEKPTDLLTYLIRNSSDVGDVIFDPFMGSGSTGVACVNTNRKFIGIELDKNYYNISYTRISDTLHIV